MMLLKKLLGEVPTVYAKGGGKSAPPPPPPPMVQPTAPVQEASVEIDSDERTKKKQRTGKSSLKLPLADTGSTGLKA